MGASRLKMLLRQASQSWARARRGLDYSGNPDYLHGVQRGLREAVRIVQDEQRVDVRRRRSERRALTRWNAIILYRACQAARNWLRQSHSRRALQVLERALAQVFLPPPAA